jgi:hypothetical protein
LRIFDQPAQKSGFGADKSGSFPPCETGDDLAGQLSSGRLPGALLRDEFGRHQISKRASHASDMKWLLTAVPASPRGESTTLPGVSKERQHVDSAALAMGGAPLYRRSRFHVIKLYRLPLKLSSCLPIISRRVKRNQNL